MKKTYIIAEAGVNHNGSLDLAKELIDVAESAGADAVKFQMFRPEALASADAEKVAYQKRQTGGDSQLEMLKRLELSQEHYWELLDYSQSYQLDLFATGFDEESLLFLQGCGMPFAKIPSGEIDNVPLLQLNARLGLPVILSTGMANLGDVEFALSIIEAEGIVREDITILHCSTQYPTPMEDVNLSAMQTLRAAFPGVAIGYSDHTEGIEIPTAAAALGATVIEKHFTTDRTLEGPDHAASLEPDGLRAMVSAIRHVDLALGHGRKEPSEEERRTLPKIRKGIFAKEAIRKGDLLTESNVSTKRPVSGLPARHFQELLGSVAQSDLEEGEPICELRIQR